MACHRLLQKDIVTLCRKRGLSIGKFTKAQLIVQLEEDDRSKEQIPDPKWGYSRIWKQLEREPGTPKTPVPDQTRVFTIGFPIGGSRRTGLELSPREREDCERQREPEKELQKQQQHELAVGERRGLGDPPGGRRLSAGDTPEQTAHGVLQLRQAPAEQWIHSAPCPAQGCPRASHAQGKSRPNLDPGGGADGGQIGPDSPGGPSLRPPTLRPMEPARRRRCVHTAQRQPAAGAQSSPLHTRPSQHPASHCSQAQQLQRKVPGTRPWAAVGQHSAAW
ncbi:uncharacterized protein [Lepidochelys kempii]|uniref:uncharacterized protein n=1 Tax=Lepidochelys kempii TaxID=8472 RepID=UPI003C6F4CBC